MTTTLIAVSLGWGAVLAAGAAFVRSLFPEPTSDDLARVDRERVPYAPIVDHDGSIGIQVARTCGRTTRKYVGAHSLRTVVGQTVRRIRRHVRSWSRVERFWEVDESKLTSTVDEWISTIKQMAREYTPRHSIAGA